MSDRKRYVLDIETYRNFFYVGIKLIGVEKRVGFELSSRKPEGFDRAWMRRFLRNNSTVTFNGMTYDMQVLFYAITPLEEVVDSDGVVTEIYPTNAQIKEVSDRIIMGNVRYWEASEVTGVRLPRDMDHIDLIEPQPNPFASLKILNGRMHGVQMQDLPVSPDATLTDEEMETTANYCLFSDLDATENLWNAMREPIALREALGADIGVDLRSKSDTQVGLAIIKHRCEAELGRKLDKPTVKPGHIFRYKAPDYISFHDPMLRDILARIQEHQFVVRDDGKVDLPKWLGEAQIKIGESTFAMGIGGLHSTESNRAVVADEDRTIVSADVASYYPAIILSLGLYPPAIGPAFLKVYRAIRDDRVKAKHAKDKVRDKGLKISLNGCFGSLGSRYSFVYAPHLLIAVTLTGQLALLMLIERAVRQGYTVISANTDGAEFMCPRDEFAGIARDRLNPCPLEEITSQWERDTGFDLEFVEYKALYNQSVNSYFALKADGSHKRKGPMANPWSSDKADNDARGQLMKNPSATICSDAALARIKYGTPLATTIRNCPDIRQFLSVTKVTKGATWRGNYLGKTIRFYWSTDGDEIIEAAPNATGTYKKVPRTDGCKELMRLPDTLPDDIDYEKYIAEADQILRDIGFYGAPEPKERRIRLTKVNRAKVLRAWLLAA